MSVEIVPPVTQTCSNCKHWGRGFDASDKLEYLSYFPNQHKLSKLIELSKKYPFRIVDKCQKTENEKSEKYMVYVGTFMSKTRVFQRETTKDWYCPLWEKLDKLDNTIRLSFYEWFELKGYKGKKVYDISVKGCELLGNTFFLRNRKDRLRYSTRSYSTLYKIDEETFDAVIKECILKNKGWFW